MLIKIILKNKKLSFGLENKYWSIPYEPEIYK